MRDRQALYSELKKHSVAGNSQAVNELVRELALHYPDPLDLAMQIDLFALNPALDGNQPEVALMLLEMMLKHIEAAKNPNNMMFNTSASTASKALKKGHLGLAYTIIAKSPEIGVSVIKSNIFLLTLPGASPSAIEALLSLINKEDTLRPSNRGYEESSPHEKSLNWLDIALYQAARHNKSLVNRLLDHGASPKMLTKAAACLGNLAKVEADINAARGNLEKKDLIHTAIVGAIEGNQNVILNNLLEKDSTMASEALFHYLMTPANYNIDGLNTILSFYPNVREVFERINRMDQIPAWIENAFDSYANDTQGRANFLKRFIDPIENSQFKARFIETFVAPFDPEVAAILIPVQQDSNDNSTVSNANELLTMENVPPTNPIIQQQKSVTECKKSQTQQEINEDMEKRKISATKRLSRLNSHLNVSNFVPPELQEQYDNSFKKEVTNTYNVNNDIPDTNTIINGMARSNNTSISRQFSQPHSNNAPGQFSMPNVERANRRVNIISSQTPAQSQPVANIKSSSFFSSSQGNTPRTIQKLTIPSQKKQ